MEKWQYKPGIHDASFAFKSPFKLWLTTGRWFSLDTPVSSTNKTYRHDITEILLKVALNTITLTLRLSDFDMCCSGKCLGKIFGRRYWGNVVEKESFMASLRKWKHDPLHTCILIMPLSITYLNLNILVRTWKMICWGWMGHVRNVWYYVIPCNTCEEIDLYCLDYLTMYVLCHITAKLVCLFLSIRTHNIILYKNDVLHTYKCIYIYNDS
jgi:hypothetical protein